MATSKGSKNRKSEKERDKKETKKKDELSYKENAYCLVIIESKVRGNIL